MKLIKLVEVKTPIWIWKWINWEYCETVYCNEIQFMLFYHRQEQWYYGQQCIVAATRTILCQQYHLNWESPTITSNSISNIFTRQSYNHDCHQRHSVLPGVCQHLQPQHPPHELLLHQAVDSPWGTWCSKERMRFTVSSGRSQVFRSIIILRLRLIHLATRQTAPHRQSSHC